MPLDTREADLPPGKEMNRRTKDTEDGENARALTFRFQGFCLHSATRRCPAFDSGMFSRHPLQSRMPCQLELLEPANVETVISGHKDYAHTHLGTLPPPGPN